MDADRRGLRGQRAHGREPRRRSPLLDELHLQQRRPAGDGDRPRRQRINDHPLLLQGGIRPASHAPHHHRLLHGRCPAVRVRRGRQYDQAPGRQHHAEARLGQRRSTLPPDRGPDRRRQLDRLHLRRRRRTAHPPRGGRRRECPVPGRHRGPSEGGHEVGQPLLHLRRLHHRPAQQRVRHGGDQLPHW
jgi:hypothetical protein